MAEKEMDKKVFNVEALDALVSLAGSSSNLEHNMYNAMGDNGWVSMGSIKNYQGKKFVPKHGIVDKFITYAQYINRPDLEFYLNPEQ